ncbi:unnamed protein product, partial [Miscanthus lutarioriparius]
RIESLKRIGVPTLFRAPTNERSCFRRLVRRGASGVCFDDAGRQPDGAVFEMGSWQRVVVLKADPLLNPNPSADGEGKAASGQEAAVAAALATASSFQAAYLHLQAAHAPFLPDAAVAADTAAVSHLRRLSELKWIARGGPADPPSPDGDGDGTLTAHLEAQVCENQALLRSFDAVVNRLQAALDAKDAAAIALRLDLEAVDDGNAWLAGRLDRALAPPPGGDAVGAMLSAGVFDSVLRDALRVAHRFARALAKVLRCAGWDLAAAVEAAYPGVSYSKAGHCRYALLSHVCLSMFDGFDSYQFGATAGTTELRGLLLVAPPACGGGGEEVAWCEIRRNAGDASSATIRNLRCSIPACADCVDAVFVFLWIL